MVAFYAALMMKDRVGEEFDATVSAVADFGFFVELDTEHVEGLVKGESLGWGFKLDTRCTRWCTRTGGGCAWARSSARG